MSNENKSWFKKALEKYDQFCEELGVNRGACRLLNLILSVMKNKITKLLQSRKINKTNKHFFISIEKCFL